MNVSCVYQAAQVWVNMARAWYLEFGQATVNMACALYRPEKGSRVLPVVSTLIEVHSIGNYNDATWNVTGALMQQLGQQEVPLQLWARVMLLQGCLCKWRGPGSFQRWLELAQGIGMVVLMEGILLALCGLCGFSNKTAW
jgi:hypothetical protein